MSSARTGDHPVVEPAEDLKARIVELECSKRKLEEKLSSYERVFFENPVPAVVYAADTLKILEANSSALQLYNCEHDALCSLNLKDLFAAEQLGNEADFAVELRSP